MGEPVGGAMATQMVEGPMPNLAHRNGRYNEEQIAWTNQWKNQGLEPEFSTYS